MVTEADIGTAMVAWLAPRLVRRRRSRGRAEDRAEAGARV